MLVVSSGKCIQHRIVNLRDDDIDDDDDDVIVNRLSDDIVG